MSAYRKGEKIESFIRFEFDWIMNNKCSNGNKQVLKFNRIPLRQKKQGKRRQEREREKKSRAFLQSFHFAFTCSSHTSHEHARAAPHLLLSLVSFYSWMFILFVKNSNNNHVLFDGNSKRGSQPN